MKKLLLFWLMLGFSFSLRAQTLTFPAESTNNTFTGTNKFNGATSINLVSYTVSTLPTPATTQIGYIATVTDASTPGSCTVGSGANLALCRNSGAAWVSLGGGLAVPISIANGGTGTTNTLTGLVRGSSSAMTGAELSGDATTSGSNAVTVVGLNGTNLAGLATGFLINTTGTGIPTADSALADSGTVLSYLGSGGISATNGALISVADGVHAGAFFCSGNTTNPALPSNTWGLICPAALTFTSWFIQPPSTGPAAISIPVLSALSGNIATLSLATVTGTGNAVLATSPTLTTPILGAAAATSLNANGANAFGVASTIGTAACETTFGTTTVSSGATTTTGLTCLPANSYILAVEYRITTAITTAASFTVGDSGSATRYCSTQSTVTIGTTGICTAAGYYFNSTALGVKITPNTTPGAGAIRLTVTYLTLTPPTS